MSASSSAQRGPRIVKSFSVGKSHPYRKALGTQEKAFGKMKRTGSNKGRGGRNGANGRSGKDTRPRKRDNDEDMSEDEDGDMGKVSNKEVLTASEPDI
jgi:hypothetical protein